MADDAGVAVAPTTGSDSGASGASPGAPASSSQATAPPASGGKNGSTQTGNGAVIGEKAAPPTAAQVAAQKIRYKVYGEEREEDFTQDQIREHIELAKGSRKAFDEAARMRKDYESFQTQFRDDPLSSMVQAATGIYGSREAAEQQVLSWLDGVLEDRAQQMAQEATIPKEMRPIYQQARDADRLRRENQELRQTRATETRQAEDRALLENYAAEVHATLGDMKLDPKSAPAQLLRLAAGSLAKQGQKVQPGLLKGFAQQIQSEIERDFAQRLKDADPASLPKELLERVRQWDIERQQKARFANPRGGQQPTHAAQEDEPETFSSLYELQKWRRQHGRV